jgi:hypothetical protein
MYENNGIFVKKTSYKHDQHVVSLGVAWKF